MNDTELLGQAERIADIFTRIMSKIMTDDLAGELDGITVAQYQALKHISQHGSSTIGSLADGLDVSQPAATTLVDRMARRGLVVRQPGRADRRQAEVSLTPEAEAMLRRLEERRMMCFSTILSHMAPGDRTQFVESLQGFIAAAIEVGAPADDACLRCGMSHSPDCVVHRAQTTGESNRTGD